MMTHINENPTFEDDDSRTGILWADYANRASRGPVDFAVHCQRQIGMSAKPNRIPAALPARSLSQLNQEADSLLQKLTRLRQNLVEMRRDLRQTIATTAPLVEANEQLVLAALHAEAVAETAVSTLGQLARSSQFDPLTNLPNRVLLHDRFETAIAAARRHETRIAVLFIDLDHFKQINDTLGHAAGDQVLQLVARRLQSAVRDSDTVSRYGGEEFIALLPEISHAADAAVIAEKLLAAIAAPARVCDQRLNLSASVGITIYPEDGEDSAMLIERADAAMYRAKRRGPGGFDFYAQKHSLARRSAEGATVDGTGAAPQAPDA